MVTYKPVFDEKLDDDTEDEKSKSNKHELRVVLQIANGKPV